ncbi:MULTISPECIES: hypothetical protein [Streptomyces]|uniref:Uncharacterized protein n=1 Tax=Streptomyces qinglanensis TaxID=943816 RepID=A0A1E7K2S4_9ACTN|nr:MULTISPECIES: hypothetical protein [Streptomyces]MBE9499162.1 hypothetical protein [Streptomyces sp. GKU 257-1]OEU98175.1 hypothetical protein AN217_10445 [Streptomyces qinglanensis]OEV26043.1 hypothetical protein AN220_10620 [Streptomyces nanshensis]
MRPRTRITVSLPADLLAHARAASGGDLSGHVEYALGARQLRDATPVLRAWRAGAGDDAEELADLFGEEIL